MKVIIEVVNNGYVVHSSDGAEVVEERDTEHVDCKAVQHLLYLVLDALGKGGSKHDVERVRVIVVDQEGVEVTYDD